MAEFIRVAGRKIGDIRIFALSTCGWCKKTKKFFNDNGIAYSYIDVDTLPASEADRVVKEQAKYNPGGSFPTIVINSKQCIVGYDEARLKELIGA
ncbi:MAG: glutaredoxin family protein [Bacillota bacterium]